MTTANLRITPDDWRDATLTTSITEQAGFEATNTQNTNRSDVYLTADTTSVDISATWSASRTASALYLFNHLLHGANFRLRLYSDAAWSSNVYDSTATAALTYSTTADSHTFSTGTKDPFKSDSASWLYFSEQTYQSAKVTFSGTPSVASYFQVGRIVLGRYKQLTRSARFGIQLGRKDLSRSDRTEGGSRRAYQVASYRTLRFDLNGINENERSFWTAFDRDVGTSEDFAVSIFAGDGTSKERDYTMNATYSNVDALGREVNRLTKTLQMEEC